MSSSDNAIAFENEVYVVPKTVFEEKDQYVCACGLSEKLPFCDGAHHRCKTVHKPVKVKIDGDNVIVRAMKHVEIEKNKEENAKVKSNFYPLLGFLAGSILFLASINCKCTRK